MIQEVLSASIDALPITRRRSAIDPQTIILLGVGIYVVLMLVVGQLVAGGWATVVQQLPAHAFDFSPQGESFADQLTYFQVWFSSGLVAISTMSVVQRSMAARTERVAQNALYFDESTNS